MLFYQTKTILISTFITSKECSWIFVAWSAPCAEVWGCVIQGHKVHFPPSHFVCTLSTFNIFFIAVVSPLNNKSISWRMSLSYSSISELQLTQCPRFTRLGACIMGSNLGCHMWCITNLGELRTEFSFLCVHGQGVTDKKEVASDQFQLKTLPSPQKKTRVASYCCCKRHRPGLAKEFLKA